MANLANPAHPGRFLGVPKHSGQDFFRFFIDFDAHRTTEIIEKTMGKHRFLYDFHIFSKIAAKSKKSGHGARRDSQNGGLGR